MLGSGWENPITSKLLTSNIISIFTV